MRAGRNIWQELREIYQDIANGYIENPTYINNVTVMSLGRFPIFHWWRHFSTDPVFM